MEDDLVVAIRLAREGYGGGDPDKILNMRVDHVIAIIHYEKFRSDYERSYIELNKEVSK